MKINYEGVRVSYYFASVTLDADVLNKILQMPLLKLELLETLNI